MTGTACNANRSDNQRLALARWLFTPLAGITFGDWLRLMGQRRLRVAPRYWPRNTFTMAMSLLNSPIAAHEARRYRKRLDAIGVRRPVFVLGHHRSGTTHLWNLLAQDPRFAYPTVLQGVFPHTFLTFEGLAHRWAQRLAPRKRPQDNVSFGPDAPIEEERAICTTSFRSMQMARHFPADRERFKPYLTLADADATAREEWRRALDRFARKLLFRHGDQRTLLFKAPDHTGKIALILSLYPDARFIHIHRHPYDVFRSTRKMERDTIPLYAYQRPHWEDLDEFILWRYRAMYDAYFTDSQDLGNDQLAELSFSELEADPVGQLERVYAQLGLPDFEQARSVVERYVDSLRGYQKNRYTDLPETTRARITEAWQPAFKRWGYTP